jgi:16S rRNA (guanine(966)-N(2))-methyltransferase RsmD
VRIIAGTAKGRIIKSNKGLETRPTLDRVREAVFNVIGETIVNSSFLDLFAGTGAIGIEALSRGAKMCCFNDRDKKAFEIIKQNTQLCKVDEKAKIYNMDVYRFIPFMKDNFQEKFDIVYIDPPYAENFYNPVISLIEENFITSENSLIICETNKNTQLQESYKFIELVKQKKYGDTLIWYYKWGRNKCGDNAPNRGI